MTDEEIKASRQREFKLQLTEIEAWLLERIERLSNQVQLQGERITAILSILKAHWMASNNYDRFKYSDEYIEREWKSFKNRFGL